MKIQGTRALVTGGSSGIGAATALALAARGAAVSLIARNQARLDGVAARVRAAGGRAETYAADLADSDQVRRAARSVIERMGVPDILINNAGAGRWLPIEETSADDLAAMVAVPFLAAFNLTRELLPGFRTRGSGHIVNVGSVGSFMAWPSAAGYIATRWAMRGFTEALRAEVDGTGIGVSLAAFAQVSSDFWDHNPGSRERLPAAAGRLRTLTPEEAAAGIVRAVERDKRLVLRPRALYALTAFSALFPRQVERRMWRGGR
jgi:uncharacterized protein